jgi:hypothetical protein
LRIDGETFDALRSTEHHADPHEVVHNRGGAGAVGSSRPNVVDQEFSGEGYCADLAEPMAFKKLKVRLLASLPFGDRLERVDVPANELAQGLGSVLRLLDGGRVLEFNFSTARPLVRCAAMRKCLRLMVKQDTVSSNANDRAVTRRTVGLLARAYRGHGVLRGDMAFLSPFFHLENR